MVILYGVSGIVCLLGLLLLIRAIRGRRVSSNPHCAHCGFDLLGLTLDRDAQCPECGRPTIPGTPTVRDGLFKRRPVLAIAALLLIGVGVTGFAWPKVSQIPSIKNFDWYAYFPESLLLKLEADGNTDAFQELFDRWSLGELSDQGFESLIAQGIKVLDDESQKWDPRWGDVLLSACNQRMLDKEQLEHYAESSIEITVKSHQQAQLISTKLGILVDSNRPNRGFGIASYSAPSSSPYRLEIEKFSVSVDGVMYEQPSRFQDSIGMSFNRGEMESWTPYQQYGYTTAMPIPLEASEPGEQSLEFIFEFSLLDGQRSIHTWESRTHAVVERRENPQYARFEDDPEKIKAAVEAMRISQIMVPSDPEAIAKDKSGQNTLVSLCTVKNDSQPPLYLMGKIVFQVGELQLDYGLSSISPGGTGISARPRRGYASNWWQFYIDHAEFWDKVAEKGSMDVLVYPDLSNARNSFDYEHVVPRAVRFVDVPVQFYLFSSAQTPEERRLTNSVFSGKTTGIQEFVPAELVDQD